jgi:hypothetical protein
MDGTYALAEKERPLRGFSQARFSRIAIIKGPAEDLWAGSVDGNVMRKRDMRRVAGEGVEAVSIRVREAECYMPVGKGIQVIGPYGGKVLRRNGAIGIDDPQGREATRTPEYSAGEALRAASHLRRLKAALLESVSPGGNSRIAQEVVGAQALSQEFRTRRLYLHVRIDSLVFCAVKSFNEEPSDPYVRKTLSERFLNIEKQPAQRIQRHANLSQIKTGGAAPGESSDDAGPRFCDRQNRNPLIRVSVRRLPDPNEGTLALARTCELPPAGTGSKSLRNRSILRRRTACAPLPASRGGADSCSTDFSKTAGRMRSRILRSR